MRTYLLYTDSLDASRAKLHVESGEHAGPVPTVGAVFNIDTVRYTVRAVEWDVYTEPDAHNPASPDMYPQQCVTVLLLKKEKRRG